MARSAVWVMERAVLDYAQPFRKLGGAPVKPQGGPSAGFAHHLNLQPAYTVTDARSQRLGSCFLGGKSGGKAFGGVALAQAISLFRGGVYAVEKALAVAIH